ncbi:hypothetical protein Tco_1380722 [Tanacetum coccineum]
MALPPRDQRHPYLRYKGLQYTDVDIMDFKERLGRIYSREIHRVQVLDFQGMPELIRDVLYARMLMEHHDGDRVVVFTSRAWRRLFDIRRPLVHELILEFFRLNTADKMKIVGFGAYWAESARQIPDKGDLRDFWIGISSARPWHSPSYTSRRLGMDVGSVNIPYLLTMYLRLFAAGRKSEALISEGQFLAQLAEHFGLLAEERVRGLTVIAPALPVIDMVELVRAAEDAPAVDDGVTTGCQDFIRTYREIDDRSGEILHMDDFMYGTAHGG